MGAKVVTYLGPLTQWYCGDGGALQTNIPGVCSQCPGRTGFAPAHGVCAFPVYTAQAQVVPPGTIRGWPWVACTSQVQAAQVQALG